MVDRTARAAYLAALEDYMDGRITAFAFDERLQTIVVEGGDHTMEHVREALWYCYDDVQDHRVVADRELWQWFNRIRLLLHTDIVIERDPPPAGIALGRRHFSWRNLVALALLLLHIALVVRFGKEAYPVVCLPFGLFLGILLLVSHAQRRFRPESESDKARRHLLPFRSFAELMRARRTVPDFRPRPYPASLDTRRIRSAWVGRVMWLPGIASVLMLPGAWLLFAALPTRRR